MKADQPAYSDQDQEYQRPSTATISTGQGVRMSPVVPLQARLHDALTGEVQAFRFCQNRVMGIAGRADRQAAIGLLHVLQAPR
nr:hypothetical protein [Sphingomonas aliaeris]